MPKGKNIFYMDVLILLALISVLAPAFHADCLTDDTAVAQHGNAIKTRLSRESERLMAVHAKERHLLEDLARIENEVAALKRSVGAMNGKIRQWERQAEALEHELRGLEQSGKSTEDRMAVRLEALYKYARNGYLNVIVDARDLHAFSRRIKYAGTIMDQDMRELASLASKKTAFEQKISRVKEEMADHGNSMERERESLETLKRDLNNGVLRLMKIHQEKEFYETAVRELRLAAKEVHQAVADMPPPKAPAVGPDARFETYKGKLEFPLEGNVVRGRKFLKTGDSHLEKGIFIEASGDTDVRAVFPGRVEFSGRLKGYGEMVIISHGSRFFTISAFLEQRWKEKGASVSMGEAIGTAGKGGPGGVRLLYFEIREAEKGLDPLKWLKAA
ncbi:MAG: peptidoglycan DD-metalloendopeptidase family protein [Deltaproteobacteria bacterium]|nr:peptidoglycan DD-metalloendopeptidase family protein [Deltaproteobacteria bacterium]